MERFKGIKVVAFDADDTLWDCQSYFEKAIDACREMLSPWVDGKTFDEGLVATERRNMPTLGYGTKAFTLSLLEAAVNLSGGKISGDLVGRILQLGHNLLDMPIHPLPGVEQTLAHLYEEGRYRLAVFTKGELLDQQNKLKRSGLLKYFHHTEIVSDKTRRAFLALCRTMRVAPGSMLMVGNSLKSDITPAIEVGAAAVHIPFHLTWELEQTADFSHERMVKIDRFDELLNLI